MLTKSFQYAITQCYSGGSREGAWGPTPPPYFWTKLKPDGLKKIFWKTPHPPPPLFQGLDDLPPTLIWIRHGNYKPFYGVQG